MLSFAPDKVVIIGNISEDPFAIDVGHQFGQLNDLSDIIALSTYANSEFCPRFISDEADLNLVGRRLEGLTVVIVSTTNERHTRQQLAMRNLILARAAKDNGAAQVVLLEPDLFYSAQDRGPGPGHVRPLRERALDDRKKFDGQAFTSLLYAEMLKMAGVDAVITVHNHSHGVQSLFSQIFEGKFFNLLPSDLYADYLRRSNMVDAGDDGKNLVAVMERASRPRRAPTARRVALTPQESATASAKGRRPGRGSDSGEGATLAGYPVRARARDECLSVEPGAGIRAPCHDANPWDERVAGIEMGFVAGCRRRAFIGGA